MATHLTFSGLFSSLVDFVMIMAGVYSFFLSVKRQPKTLYGKFLNRILWEHCNTKTESAKLLALCAKTCSRDNVSCVLTFSRANVPTCLVYLRAHVPLCLACSRATVPCELTCSRDNMPWVSLPLLLKFYTLLVRFKSLIKREFIYNPSLLIYVGLRRGNIDETFVNYWHVLVS